jgi:hypothetical protein
MKEILLIVLVAMVCSPADAQRVEDESIPKAKSTFTSKWMA